MSENYILSKAEKSDICDIYNLLLEYSEKEIVLKRSKEDILKYLFNFYVIKKNDNIIGCGALRDFSDNLYEIRSLVISSDFIGKGLGKLLVEYIIEDLKSRATKCNIFALTYQVNFFLRLGFKVTDKNQFPDKIWADCKDCKKRNCCDETAMYLSINEKCQKKDDKMGKEIEEGANVDFACINNECQNKIVFNLLTHLENKNKQVVCSKCHSSYELDDELLEKLKKLRTLINTIKDSKDILSECNVGVATPNGEVKIPYLLLLTRMTTMISIELNGQKVDFNFRIEPSSKSEVFK